MLLFVKAPIILVAQIMFTNNYNLEESELASLMQVQVSKKFGDKKALSAFMSGRYHLHLFRDHLKESEHCTLCNFDILSLSNSDGSACSI